MADEFGRGFQYGLGDLPMEPPDDFSALNPAAGFTAMNAGQLPPPEVIPAGFRFPLPRRAPVGAYPAPGFADPENPAPRIPDWWRALGVAAQILPRMTSGFGGGGGGDDDSNSCDKRHKREMSRCRYRPEKYQPDCRQRATIRWDKCNRNGGSPSPDEPKQWSRLDEEESFNPRTFR